MYKKKIEVRIESCSDSKGGVRLPNPSRCVSNADERSKSLKLNIKQSLFVFSKLISDSVNPQ